MDINTIEKFIIDSKYNFKDNTALPKYTFFDGPPFATGTPHYGHILASTIKDIICRYNNMKGFYVPRQFGWDCHGVPVEYEVDKKLKITSKNEINIKEYNNICRSVVMQCENDWEYVIKRIGRHVDDFRSSYKTMDTDYMETCWKVFKKLYNKGLVYKGTKVMPYSTGITTVLSNFEAGQNYKDVKDTDAIIAFKLIEADEYLLAWTTTPWTLVANIALCVNDTIDYVKCKYEDKIVICSEFAANKYNWEIISDTFKGNCLVNKKYIPLYNYFAKHVQSTSSDYLIEKNKVFPVSNDKYFCILSDTFVTSESGTGIVHIAPGFGEDDYNVCIKNNIISKTDNIPCPVDKNGCYTYPINEPLFGIYVKDKFVEKEILRDLKERNILINSSTYTHSYPHCYRTDLPIIYKLVSSWFINVENEELKENLINCNKQTTWVPNHIKEKRFNNWLENARDWSVSRTRYWGTPIPIWTSDDGSEVVVIGSINELKEKANIDNITDLHRDSIDHITIPSANPNNPPLKRIPDVFDCWFESGCMPVARGDPNNFEPADFVAEGIDQTRGWFYTTMVITAALYNKPPFKNVICNGHILAADGKKMSKRLKNYPDPLDVINKYGADALRLYLINSPVVKGESLKFVEKGVNDMLRDVIIPLHNSINFYEQSKVTTTKKCKDTFMDIWIKNLVIRLTNNIRKNLDNYQLAPCIPELITTIDRLNNIYIRMNRSRIKSGENKTLQLVLVELCKIIAPFAPFNSEYLYHKLRTSDESIHNLEFPEYIEQSDYSINIINCMENFNTIIELARNHRINKLKRATKIPVKDMTIIVKDKMLLEQIEKNCNELLKEELNIKDINYSTDIDKYVDTKYMINFTSISKKIKSNFNTNNILKYINDSTEYPIKIEDIIIDKEDILVKYLLKNDFLKTASISNNIIIIMNEELNQELIDEGIARDVLHLINDTKKKNNITINDKLHIIVNHSDLNDNIIEIINQSDKLNGDSIEFIVCNNKEINIGFVQR